TASFSCSPFVPLSKIALTRSMGVCVRACRTIVDKHSVLTNEICFEIGNCEIICSLGAGTLDYCFYDHAATIAGHDSHPNFKLLGRQPALSGDPPRMVVGCLEVLAFAVRSCEDDLPNNAFVPHDKVCYFFEGGLAGFFGTSPNFV